MPPSASATIPPPVRGCAATSAWVTRSAEGGGSVTMDWAAKALRISVATAAASADVVGRRWKFISTRTVARAPHRAYVGEMSETPAFLDGDRPPVPDIVVPRGVTPFYVPKQPVRGRLVRLGPLAEALLTRHRNHPVVTRLAGQSLALAAALSTALKFRGSFSVQAKGDGPVPMLLADCPDPGALRGYARAKQEQLESLLESDPVPGAGQLLGGG